MISTRGTEKSNFAGPSKASVGPTLQLDFEETTGTADRLTMELEAIEKLRSEACSQYDPIQNIALGAALCSAQEDSAHSLSRYHLQDVTKTICSDHACSERHFVRMTKDEYNEAARRCTSRQPEQTDGQHATESATPCEDFRCMKSHLWDTQFCPINIGDVLLRPWGPKDTPRYLSHLEIPVDREELGIRSCGHHLEKERTRFTKLQIPVIGPTSTETSLFRSPSSQTDPSQSTPSQTGLETPSAPSQTTSSITLPSFSAMFPPEFMQSLRQSPSQNGSRRAGNPALPFLVTAQGQRTSAITDGTTQLIEGYHQQDTRVDDDE